MWENLLQQDRNWFLTLNGWGNEHWDAFWLFLSDKWAGIPLYLVLVFFLYRQLGWKRLLLSLFFIGLLITCSDQLANFFKYGVERLRPCHEENLNGLMRLVKPKCGGEFGFYSAHASNAFGVAVFFATLWMRQFKSGMLLLLFWGLAVGYSRVYLGVHYPLDIFIGFLTGGALGWIFAQLLKRAMMKWLP